MRILITGCNGFIGKNLVNHLQEIQAEIIGLARSGSNENNKIFEYVQCDLSQDRLTGDICNNVEIVIHLAGLASPDSKKQDLYNNNVKATINLLRSAKKYKVKKFIFASSLKVNEDNSYYAHTKSEAEQAVINSCEKSQIDYTILRIAQVYGRAMKSNVTGWLFKIRDGSIGKIPQSKSVIPMIGINDLCKIIKCCIDNSQTSKKVYSVTDCNNYSVNEIEALARKAVSRNSNNYTYPRLLLYLLGIVGDLLSLIWAGFPFQSRYYRMLFENTTIHDAAIYEDCNVKVTENFYDFIPELLEVTT